LLKSKEKLQELDPESTDIESGNAVRNGTTRRRQFGAYNSARPSRRRYNSTPAIRRGTFRRHTYGERETL